MEEGRKVGSK